MMLVIAGHQERGLHELRNAATHLVALLIEGRQLCPCCPGSLLLLSSGCIHGGGGPSDRTTAIGPPHRAAVPLFLTDVVLIGSSVFPSHTFLASLAVCPGSGLPCIMF